MKDCAGWITIFMLACTMPPPSRLEAQQRGLPVATVHVEVFGPFGSAVRASTMRLLAADKAREFSDAGDGRTISDVPYGQYRLIVSDSGGGVAEREVVVNVKEVWVRVGLPFPTGDRAWPGGDLTISGDLVPTPLNLKDWWVRIDGVFLHVSREAPILNRGQFSIRGLEMGTYLVEVFDGAKLRHAETVEIDTKVPNAHLRIALSGIPRK